MSSIWHVYLPVPLWSVMIFWWCWNAMTQQAAKNSSLQQNEDNAFVQMGSVRNKHITTWVHCHSLWHLLFFLSLTHTYKCHKWIMSLSHTHENRWTQTYHNRLIHALMKPLIQKNVLRIRYVGIFALSDMLKQHKSVCLYANPIYKLHIIFDTLTLKCFLDVVNLTKLNRLYFCPSNHIK